MSRAWFCSNPSCAYRNIYVYVTISQLGVVERATSTDKNGARASTSSHVLVIRCARGTAPIACCSAAQPLRQQPSAARKRVRAAQHAGRRARHRRVSIFRNMHDLDFAYLPRRYVGTNAAVSWMAMMGNLGEGVTRRWRPRAPAPSAASPPSHR